MKNISLEFGCLAKPMKEQLPELDDDTAAQFDADNLAIARLRVRGLISDGERLKIDRRFAASIGEAVSKAKRVQ